jgi:hypothetical protein
MTLLDDAARRRLLEAAFKMPSMQSIVARKSTITNAFVNSLIPAIRPTPNEIEEALRILGMTPDNVRCAYCGDRNSEWDHLRPLVLKERPTGYISEIANLVPSCGKCNQSKRNEAWRTWIVGTSGKHTPARRGVADLHLRIERLDAYERWKSPTRIDFDSVAPPQEWKAYWEMRAQINEEMKRCHEMAEVIRQRIAADLLKTE